MFGNKSARILLLLLLAASVQAETHYVDRNSTNPVSPFLTWETAAVEIQAAVDVATNGSTVLVTNGVYDTGGAVNPGHSLMNRVCITNAITVQSVNGPEETIIEGKPGANGGNDNDSIRGVYLGSQASLIGFTITKGHTKGAYTSAADRYGGGLFMTENSEATHCILRNNKSYYPGGGAYLYGGGTLNNSILTENNARNAGGGAFLRDGGVLNNCTLSGNSAEDVAGGLYLKNGTVNNCIIWDNSADDHPSLYEEHDSENFLRFCCVADGVDHGIDGCITNDPLFVDGHGGNFQLFPNSPCIDTGNNTNAPAGTDLFGHARIINGVVDMGAYEMPITPRFRITTTSGENGTISPENPMAFQGLDQTFLIQPNPGFLIEALAVDGISQPVASNYTFTNVQTTHVVSATFIWDSSFLQHVYVDAARPDDSGAGTSWATAKQTIQAGVDRVGTGGTVWVTNGVYDAGGIPPNRLSNTNAITVQSVNGPGVTVIDGKGSVRGVFMQNGGSLSGFTVRNGYADRGGGIRLYAGCVVSDCIIRDNIANDDGGGAYSDGMLNNCLFLSNQTPFAGGGVYLKGNGTLNNCTIVENLVTDWEFSWGGGVAAVSGSEVNNCIFLNNRAEGRIRNVSSDGTVRNTCSANGVTDGVNGCIKADPLFVDFSNGDYRLQADSPCINSGDNAYAPTGFDLAGNTRIQGGTVDMGVFETPDVPGLRITTTAGTNGSISPESPMLFQSEEQTFLIQPEYSYRVDTLLVDGIPQPAAPTYTLSNIQTAHTLSATFVLDTNIPLNVYVDASRPNDLGAGTDWATAKRTIQAGVDLVRNEGTVWVTNGVYDEGSTPTPRYNTPNRVYITRPFTVCSVNGPDVTVIDGKGSVRGVYMANGSSLSGFTVTNGYASAPDGAPVGHAGWAGGGIWLSADCVVSECVLIKNRATEKFNMGGGACLYRGGTLNNCILTKNSATYGDGGGAYLHYGGELNNCLLTKNFAPDWDLGNGGGACADGGGALNNCTLVENKAGLDGGGVRLYPGGTLKNCIVQNNVSDGSDNIVGPAYFTCAPDGISHGINGCITNDPLFVEATNNNFRLQSNSPCINAGNNAYVSTTNDLDNLPRIVGGVVDMGAYERQDAGTDVDADALPDLWEMTHFESRHFTDPSTISSNGVNTLLDAYIAGFNPNDPDAAFLVSIFPGRVLEWEDLSGRTYCVYYKTNITDQALVPLQGDCSGGSFTDTVHHAEQKGFYRVKVQLAP